MCIDAAALCKTMNFFHILEEGALRLCITLKGALTEKCLKNTGLDPNILKKLQKKKEA